MESRPSSQSARREAPAASAAPAPELLLPFPAVERDAPASPPALAEPRRRVRVEGLRRTMNELLGQLRAAAQDGRPTIEEVSERIEAERRALEQTIREAGAGPDELMPETRSVRGWIALHADPEWTGRAVAARRVVARLVRERVDHSDALLRHLTGRRRIPRRLLASADERAIVVHFRPMRPLTRAEVRDRRLHMSLPTSMMVLDRAALADVVGLVEGDAGSRRRVHEAMLAEPFQTLRRRLERLGGEVPVEPGRAHDLEASFDRVNAAYFDGAMARPRLAWSRTLTRRLFGHYEFSGDVLMVSATLDHPDVPRFVVDFIVYHELLHKRHGLEWVGDRAHAHTPSFRRDERRFERYDEAERALRRIAREGPEAMARLG